MLTVNRPASGDAQKLRMMAIEFFHSKSMNSLKSMTKNYSQIGFDPSICSVEFQSGHHYAIEPSVIALIFKITLVYASLVLEILLNLVNLLTVPAKMEKVECSL